MRERAPCAVIRTGQVADVAVSLEELHTWIPHVKLRWTRVLQEAGHSKEIIP